MTSASPAVPESAAPATAVSRGVAAMFFVSGALALVYETLWQRQFALVFGSAAPATAAVLAAYFAGLGLGAYGLGRMIRRGARPLRLYALLEAGVGIGALLVTPLLHGLDGIYPWLTTTFSSHSGFLLVRTAAAFFALLIPTFCMGGTLPVLGELIDQTHQRLGVTVGWLYVINTLGAGLGALAVPFLFLPRIGMAGTVVLCAALNIVLALGAWVLDRRSGPGVTATNAARASVAPREILAVARGGWLGLALISGAATFALQVLWNRAFAQVHENSMYSFAIIVAVVIFSLALGGQIARVTLRRGHDPRRIVALAWLGAGVLTVASPWLFFSLSHGLGYVPTGASWSGDALRLLKLAAAMILLPMTLLGVGLPAIMEQAGHESGDATSQVLGRLLATNVVGSVTGALVAGFLLPAWLGLWGGMVWVGGLLIAVGLWQRMQSRMAHPNRMIGYGLLAAWALSAMAASHVPIPRVRISSQETEKVLALTEGPHGITAVVERDGSRRIKLNNFYGLGGTLATADERMQAHVPLLLHPAPRSVAFLGMGTSITAGGAQFHPLDRVTIMELVPEVVTAAKTFFGEANARVLEDPRTRVIEDDARHYLRGSGETYDVIIGDLVVPWRQGEGSLFTLEQFQAARAALKPKGVFCQWLPLFQLSETELTILARTFLTVFPQAEVWRGDFWPDEPAIALIGGAEGFRLDPKAIDERLAQMKNDPANPQLRAPEIFWMHRVGVIQETDLPSDDLRLNREDRPWIELLGPLEHGGGNQEKLFTGRRLQKWLNQIRDRTRTRSPELPKELQEGLAAGAVFEEMMLCVSEDNKPGIEAAQQQLSRLLSEPAFQKLMYR